MAKARGHRVYTELDQARVAVMLQANEGNVKRTARETGVPTMTVHSWKRKWEQEGYPETVEEILPAVREATIDSFKEIVSLASQRVWEQLQRDEVKAKDAAWIAGLFTDKIRLALGQPTSRTETVQALPDPKELAKELATYVAQTVDDAKRRVTEIEDAELEQAKALPPGIRR